MTDNQTEPIEDKNILEEQNSIFTDTLAARRKEMEKARKEYYSSEELVQQRQKELNEVNELWGEHYRQEKILVEKRDDLNVELQEKRKEIKQIKLELENAQKELSELTSVTIEIRKDVIKERQKSDTILQGYSSIENRLKEAKQTSELSLQKLKSTEESYLAAGGELHKKESSQKLKDTEESCLVEEGGARKKSIEKSRQSPWVTGSFYIFAIIFILMVLAIISTKVPWYSLAIVIIGGLIGIAMVGILQLRHDEALSEENFKVLMMESMKNLPLLRSSNDSMQEPENSQSHEDTDI